MLRHVFVVLLTILSFTRADFLQSRYRTFMPCDPRIVQGIQDYWRCYGTPQHPYRMMTKTKSYVDLYTSYTYTSDSYSCIYLDVGNCFLNFTLEQGNGGDARQNPYRVYEDCNGIILGNPVYLNDPKYNFIWYVIQADSDVVAEYGCGYDPESPYPPKGNIFIGSTKYCDRKAMNKVKRLYTFMTSQGINFTGSSGQECFNRCDSN